MYFWDVGSGLAHMRGVIWRAALAKFQRGMCEMKILRSEFLWCVFRMGWLTCVVYYGELFRQSSKQGCVR